MELTCCPILATPRLLLRPYREADFPAAHEYAADPEVSQYMAWGPNTEAQTREFIAQAVALAADLEPNGYHFAIVRKADGRLLGGCNLHHTDKAERTAMVGYTLNSRFWRQGVTSEAAAALLRFGFGTLGLHRIISWCDPDNTGSWRVMEKIGMTREGREREAAWFKGRWHDWLRYGILDYEWAARDQTLSVVLTREDAAGEIGRALRERLSAELAGRYPEDPAEGSGGFDPLTLPGAAFFVAWANALPVGCGAARPLLPGIGELKRMFVAPEFRRQGIASALLAALEEEARGFGYQRLWLQTALRQPEAIGLYDRSGYARIPCFGGYAGDPLSVCYEKRL